MGASIVMNSCRFCKGGGEVQSLEERRELGWHRNTMLPHWLADAWIAADRHAPLRWVDCDCPVCDGEGSYMVETVRAKIF